MSTMALPPATERRHVVDVQDDVVAVGEDAFDLAVIVGEFLAQESEKGLQALRPVGGPGIVLDVTRAEEFRGCLEVLLIDRKLIEFRHGLLVFFHLLGVGGVCGRSQRDHRGGEEETKHGNLQSFESFIPRSKATKRSPFGSYHMCDGSQSAKIGNAIRITSRMRSVTMNGSTPRKIVEKLTSCTTLLITNTFMPTGG